MRVYAQTGAQGDALVERIRAMTKEVEVGDEFAAAKVVKTTTFGAFVELAKGTDGLLHISNVSPGQRVATVEEVLNKGDEVVGPRGRGRPRARPHRPPPRRGPRHRGQDARRSWRRSAPATAAAAASAAAAVAATAGATAAAAGAAATAIASAARRAAIGIPIGASPDRAADHGA